jgi:hypothetical protein
MKRTLLIFLALMAVVCWLPGQAAALETYSFDAFTFTTTLDESQGEAQLRMDVLAPGEDSVSSGQVGFKFYLLGSDAMTITKVLFADGDLFLNPTSPTKIEYPTYNTSTKTGVLFTVNTSPSDSEFPWQTTSALDAFVSEDADSPPAKTGVGLGESLEVVFTMKTGKGYSDVISALSTSSLAVGLHVQSFSDGGSAKFVDTPSPLGSVVPLPGAVLLLGAGLVRLAAYARRRREE